MPVGPIIQLPLSPAGYPRNSAVLASPVVCSDETSVRVKGKSWWEWVFIGTLAVGTTAKLRVRRQWRSAGTNRWLDGISVHRRILSDCFPGAHRIRLCAMCLITARLAGA
jgi:hypothetical protein